ncbi:MAG TPA: YraN family protein [Clostridiales bacterium]|jgi:putative endonuclease|nr:YraN family protein [Clostridiales bacterium]
MKNLLGAAGEAAAARYLRAKGYTIEAANIRSRFGEVDLVATNRAYIVFVEVKTRKSAAFARPMEHVTARKLEKIKATALLYLSEHPTKLQPRFDVIEVYLPNGPAGEPAHIEHLENVLC